MYFVRFIVLKLIPGRPLKPLYLTYLIVGIIAFLVMIPLFITSFKKIRIKMKYPEWKKLQRFAYLFYLLVYIKLFELIVYTIVFGAYFILKLIKTSTYKYKFQR